MKNPKIKYLCLLLSVLTTLGLLLTTASTLLAQGATTPFRSYEAEDGTLAGGATVRSLGALPTTPTPELEASGAKFVELNATGESLTWTTTATANTIVVRACIPDAPGGGGTTATLNLYVNGIFRQALTLNSAYTWVYGVNGFTDNNPATGTPKRFWDEFRAFVADAAIPAGATVMLKKDAANTAAFYYIDVIDLENVGPALPQPANTLSITSYGATPNDNTDDGSAIIACANASKAQGKGMWIPPGRFNTAAKITFTGVNIYGAGMWYTTIYHPIGANFAWEMADSTVRDVYVDSPAAGRGSSTGGSSSAFQAKGVSGWLIERIWSHNCDALWLSGTDGIIRDSRVGSSWADGINLNNGPDTTDATKRGIRLTSQNNFIRGTGDDGIAINAQNGGGATYNMVDAKILNNTCIGSYWANGIRVAGGRNSLVQNNLVTDTGDNNGIKVAKFGTLGNPCESALVTGNQVFRGAGIRGTVAGMMVTDDAVATISSNTIVDSRQAGVLVINCTVNFTGNAIIHPTLQGFRVPSGSVGSGTFSNNFVAGLNSGQVAFLNSSSTFTATLAGDNNWQIPSLIDTDSDGIPDQYEIANGLNSVAAADAPLDLDGDGLKNGLEYALGTAANSAASAAVPTQGFGTGADAGKLTLTFARARADVIYTVQASSDLVTWVDLAINRGSVGTNVTVTDTTSATLTRFIRLKTQVGPNVFKTVPVGYLKSEIAGGTLAVPATTALGIPLDDPAAPAAGIRAGRIEAFTSTTLTNASGGWTGNLANPAAPWLMRLTSGPAAGKTLDITSNTTTSLTVSGADLSGLGLTAGIDTFELIPLDTLSSLFGSTTLLGGTSASTADNVQVRSGTSWLVYYYDTNLGFWRRTIGPATNSNNVRIRPESGVQIIRRGPATTLTFTGRAPTTTFRPSINNATTTVIHAGFPTDTTLGTLALQTLLPGWHSSASAADADTVFLFNGTTWVAYFHNGSFWQTAANADADPTAIPAGALLTIQRPGATPGTADLVLPPPYSL